MKKLTLLAIVFFLFWGCGDDGGNYDPVGFYSISYELEGLDDCDGDLPLIIDTDWIIDKDWQIEDDGDDFKTDMDCDSDGCIFSFEFMGIVIDEIDLIFVINGAGKINSSGQVDGVIYITLSTDPIQPGHPCSNEYSISGEKD